MIRIREAKFINRESPVIQLDNIRQAEAGARLWDTVYEVLEDDFIPDKGFSTYLDEFIDESLKQKNLLTKDGKYVTIYPIKSEEEQT